MLAAVITLTVGTAPQPFGSNFVLPRLGHGLELVCPRCSMFLLSRDRYLNPLLSAYDQRLEAAQAEAAGRAQAAKDIQVQ